MYIPPDSQNLNALPPNTKPQTRILLQGAPSAGKTHLAATFPNPIFLDFDNKMSAHVGKNIVRVPFYDTDFVANKLKCSNGPKRQPNRKDALKYWLADHGPKLAPEQTLIVDSWTKVQDAYDYQHSEVDKFISKKDGEEDGWMFYRIKIKYSTDICNALMAVPCNFVIVICHEHKQYDPKGHRLIDKIKPLQEGAFISKFSSYFTDTWRLSVYDKLDAEGKPVYRKDANGKETKEKEVERYIQVRSSGEVDLNCSLKPTIPMFIPASFEEISKWI